MWWKILLILLDAAWIAVLLYFYIYFWLDALLLV